MTTIQGNFGLLMKRAHMLASDGYLARADFQEKVVWHRTGNGHVLCSRPKAIDDGPIPIVVSLVAVPSTSNWYNKLSGLGDYDERYQKGANKLKWLLHVGAPSGTIFMEELGAGNFDTKVSSAARCHWGTQGYDDEERQRNRTSLES